MIDPALLVAGAVSWAPAGATEAAAGMKPVAMSQSPRRMKTVATSARTSRMTREYPRAGAATNALSSIGRRQERARGIGWKRYGCSIVAKKLRDDDEEVTSDR